MSKIVELLQAPPHVVNLGLAGFAENLTAHGTPCVAVEWQPPAGGDPELGRLLHRLEPYAERIAAANAEAVQRLIAARPVWTAVGPAREVIPGFTPTTILHAGPPVSWENMCGPMQGAICGALVFEGLATDLAEAERVAASGRISFSPCHHFGAVGPMSGVISASMPVIVVENLEFGNRAYSSFNNEGNPNSALSFGFNGPEALAMLRWQRDVVGPVLGRTIQELGGLDLKSIMAKAIQMGDDVHNRHVASTSLLVRQLLPTLARLRLPAVDLAEMGEWFIRNDWFFLNFSMAACKASVDPARGIPWSTMVVAMARNGVETGIQISALDKQWFTAPAPRVKGLYWPGYTEADANPDLGDSAITETAGVGAFAMAAAPAMTKLVGGSVAEAISFTKEMGEIALATNPAFTVPHLDFAEIPAGIDIRKVVETGMTPVINTGIAHRKAGLGMVGAGVARIPLKCFAEALAAFASAAADGTFPD